MGAVQDRLDALQGLRDAFAHGAQVGPQRGELGDGFDAVAYGLDAVAEAGEAAADAVHPVADDLDVLREALGPHGGTGGELAETSPHVLQRAAEATELAFPHLSQDPLHAFQPLADLVEHGALGALLVDVVLCGAREELAHAVGDGGLASRLEEGVVGVVHRGLLRSPAHAWR